VDYKALYKQLPTLQNALSASAYKCLCFQAVPTPWCIMVLGQCYCDGPSTIGSCKVHRLPMPFFLHDGANVRDNIEALVQAMVSEG